MVESFKCDVCDHTTDTLSKHNRHLNTKKHLILLETQNKEVDNKPLKKKDRKSSKVLPTVKEAKESKKPKQSKESKKPKEAKEPKEVDNRSDEDIIKDLKGQVKVHQANEKRLNKELAEANEKNKDVTLQLCDALQKLYEMNRSDNPDNKNSNNTITTTNNDIRIVNIYIHYTTDEELTELTSPEISRKITALITEFIPTDDCKQEFIDKYNESMPI